MMTGTVATKVKRTTTFRMTYAEWIPSLLLFLSINAICVAPLKVYPVLFVMFEVTSAAISISLGSRFWDSTAQTVLWWGGLFYFFYIICVYAIIGGNAYDVTKIIINVGFFLALARYTQAMVRRGRLGALVTVTCIALYVSITANFLQAVFSVQQGHLWSLPLHISNSMQAYAIQDAAPIFFGDENKNIWATKVMFEYLIYISLRKGRRHMPDYLLACFFGFTLIYTSSRTAQLAFVAAMLVPFVLKKKSKTRRFFALGLLIPILIGLVAYLRLSSLSLDTIPTTSDGDGLLARLLLWSYFASSFPSFSAVQIIFGHGVFAVSKFVHSAFSENNLHDVFLNQFFDFGCVGLLSYCSMVIFFVVSLPRRLKWTFVPVLLIVMNSQYFGYDAELMMLFALGPLLAKCSENFK